MACYSTRLTRAHGARTRKQRDPRIEALPYPYKAWLALSSDPDNTLFPDWQELDKVIWKELGLPFADSCFLWDDTRASAAVTRDQTPAAAHSSPGVTGNV